MESLWESLLNAGRGRLHCWTGEAFAEAGWDEVAADATRMAGDLRARGVGPGTVVAAILTNSPLAVRGVLAVWLAGGAVASLPVPARGMSAEEYIEQITGVCGRTGSPMLLSDGAVLSAFPEETRTSLNGLAWESVGRGRPLTEPPADDDVAFIQYSSGSTGSPKGCMLTPRAITAQLAMILEMTGADPQRERVVSWLPLSHDMGMFGCLLFPWAYDMPLALSTPERFMMGGRSWFGDLAEFGGTMTAGTNTALYIAARAQRGRPLAKPLNLRTAIIGAERVERTTLHAAVAAFEGSGLTLDRFMPAYGMAEATLAISATAPGAEPRFLAVDGTALADARIVEAAPDDPAASWLVGCGSPCRGTEVTQSQPGAVSELLVRSPSLAAGYHGDPERTGSRFTERGLRTGDLGFVQDGELFLVSRLDDVISVGGRNVNLREIELAVEALDSVHHGGTAVLDVGGERTARLVLVTEPRRRNADLGEIARAAAGIAQAKAGIVLDECVFLQRGTVPKTPSGKIQRFRARQLLLAGELPTIATLDLETG
ncbi:AMP-binding protein [Actinomadura barringtoniae]|uniref:AMP-binding protein n=1 Tax=Actinomadura barringtoniae TaxID=1427535 RepID=A0A939T3S9_9ACTN|nr:AMP-binding protein [Actinomadura barringtoniae]MBO2448568.1 AMP-binding protein [Actinomadura barringtoniae]